MSIHKYPIETNLSWKQLVAWAQHHRGGSSHHKIWNKWENVFLIQKNILIWIGTGTYLREHNMGCVSMYSTSNADPNFYLGFGSLTDLSSRSGSCQWCGSGYARIRIQDKTECSQHYDDKVLFWIRKCNEKKIKIATQLKIGANETKLLEKDESGLETLWATH